MKMRRILSVVLTVCLMAALLPTASLAAEDRKIMLGVSGISGGGTNDYIYFGNYQQSSYAPKSVPASPAEGEVYTDSDGTLFVYSGENYYSAANYYEIEPIKWRVLDAAHSYKESADGPDKTGLFLLSDVVLTQHVWHNEYDDNKYRDYGKSDIHAWLNTAGSDNFLDNVFSGGEQAGIATTYVETEDVDRFSTTPTTDKVFLLSNEEAQNSRYGLGDNAGRQSGASDYAASKGVTTYDGANWWLRSPGYPYGLSDAYASVVTYDGTLYIYGGNVAVPNLGVRPAFNLNPDSVLFTSAAAGGKPGDSAVGDIFENVDNSSNEWKLTLLDSGRSGFQAEAAGQTGDTLTISYSGAEAAVNEYISAIIVDADGNISHYGRLGYAENNAQGTVTLTLPQGFNAAEDKLYIFNEQYNGDYKTDYAGALKEIKLYTVNPGPTPDASASPDVTDDPDATDAPTTRKSSGGGCDAGTSAGLLAILAFFGLVKIRR